VPRPIESPNVRQFRLVAGLVLCAAGVVLLGVGCAKRSPPAADRPTDRARPFDVEEFGRRSGREFDSVAMMMFGGFLGFAGLMVAFGRRRRTPGEMEREIEDLQDEVEDLRDRRRAPPGAPSPGKCPSCGAVVPAGSGRCSFCGGGPAVRP
jgi:hypothetical protein